MSRGRKVTVDARAFTGLVATRLMLWKAFNTESVGMVKRANGYLDTAFRPERMFA